MATCRQRITIRLAVECRSLNLVCDMTNADERVLAARARGKHLLAWGLRDEPQLWFLTSDSPAWSREIRGAWRNLSGCEEYVESYSPHSRTIAPGCLREDVDRAAKALADGMAEHL